jgi:hypothetical protein
VITVGVLGTDHLGDGDEVGQAPLPLLTRLAAAEPLDRQLRANDEMIKKVRKVLGD